MKVGAMGVKGTGIGGEGPMRRRQFLAQAGALAAWGAFGGAQAQTFASVSQADAASGLRQALLIGAEVVTTRLGRTDGFWGDPRVRIPLPRTLANMQRSLRPFGLSGTLDDLELRVNRGAEQAMPQAWRLFQRTIQSITLTDALSILRGADTAATQFLRSRTEPDLTAALRPILENTLQGAGAFTSLETAMRSMALAGTAQNLRGQLIDFSVTRALDAAFSLIADEERAIRQDPVRRTSRLLRRVFGG
jgi:hypothetical protein